MVPNLGDLLGCRILYLSAGQPVQQITGSLVVAPVPDAAFLKGAIWQLGAMMACEDAIDRKMKVDCLQKLLLEKQDKGNV